MSQPIDILTRVWFNNGMTTLTVTAELKERAARMADVYERVLDGADLLTIRAPENRVYDRASGEWRVDDGGNFDWFYGLAAAEQARLRRNWMSSQCTVSVDEVEQVMAIGEWLDLTRRVDLCRVVASGRLPIDNPRGKGTVDWAGYGRLRVDSLGLDVEDDGPEDDSDPWQVGPEPECSPRVRTRGYCRRAPRTSSGHVSCREVRPQPTPPAVAAVVASQPAPPVSPMVRVQPAPPAPVPCEHCHCVELDVCAHCGAHGTLEPMAGQLDSVECWECRTVHEDVCTCTYLGRMVA